MASVKMSDVLAVLSLAVSLMSNAPVKFAGGVPVKLRVAPSKMSQGGSAEPSASVAV